MQSRFPRPWNKQDGLTRRSLLAGLVTGAPLLGQGVSTRSAAALPRGKPSGLPFRAKLTDVAAAAGLREPTSYGAPDHKNFIIETIGCGAAFIDYDNDGWLDIFLPNGSAFEGNPNSTSRLYRNNRDGTFTDVTARAGVGKQGWASAVAVGDYNNDGWTDMFVTYWGRNVLYRNNGDGTFTDVAEESGLHAAGEHWGSGCSFVDYNRDGHLDLCFATYLQFDPRRIPKPGEASNCNWKGVPVNCGPRGLPPGRVFLFRNDGKGRFTDVSKEAGIDQAKGSYCMTVAAADFDNDGWPDLYVACDSTPSFLLRNNGNGTFTDVGLESGVALNEDGMEQAGMGLGIGDFNLDGNLDIFKTHFADDTNILYANAGKNEFRDVTISSGLGVETRFTGWGAGIVDLDNDGLPDIFFVTGSVYPEVERKLASYPFRTPRIVFRNLGNGKLEELFDAGPGLSSLHASRGCAFGDFDNDGDVDVLIINLHEPPSLLRNDVSGGGNWLKVKLTGTASNRSAIGARVTARYGGRRQSQEVMSQSSFYSANDLRLHFGLGTAATADLEVRWPTGKTETFSGVRANGLFEIVEGKGGQRSGQIPSGSR